jgi:hypothetical protein
MVVTPTQVAAQARDLATDGCEAQPPGVGASWRDLRDRGGVAQRRCQLETLGGHVGLEVMLIEEHRAPPFRAVFEH